MNETGREGRKRGIPICIEDTGIHSRRPDRHHRYKQIGIAHSTTQRVDPDVLLDNPKPKSAILFPLVVVVVVVVLLLLLLGLSSNNRHNALEKNWCSHGMAPLPNSNNTHQSSPAINPSNLSMKE
jgi:hypothetical protein